MNVRLPTRRHAVDAGSTPSVEFAELLDPVWSAPVVPEVAVAALPLVEVTGVEATEVGVTDEPAIEAPVTDPVADPVATSRFADVGIDDDRLPLQTATKRFRRR